MVVSREGLFILLLSLSGQATQAALGQVVEIDNWCTNPNNRDQYRHMVHQLNSRSLCRMASERECKIFAGVGALGASVAGSAAMKQASDLSPKAPSANCLVSRRNTLEPSFYAHWQDFFISIAYARNANNPCMANLQEQSRFRNYLQRTADSLAPEAEAASSELANRAQRAQDLLHDIEQDLSRERVNLGDADSHRASLDKINQLLKQEDLRINQGWSDFLQTRATRLAQEYDAAIKSGDKNLLNSLTIDIHEFIDTNFTDDLKTELKSDAASSRVMEQLKAILQQSKGSLDDSAEAFFSWCTKVGKDCSQALKDKFIQFKKNVADYNAAASKAGLTVGKHQQLLKLIESLKLPVSTDAFAATVLKSTELVPSSHLILHELRDAATSAGLDPSHLPKYKTMRAAGQSSNLALRSLETMAKRFPGSAMAGLAKTAGKGLGRLALGATGAILGVPAMAAEMALSPSNSSQECDGSIITTEYGTYDKDCHFVAVYNDKTAAFLNLSIEEQMEHIKNFPQLCAVVRETYKALVPTRWKGSCDFNDKRETVGLSAQLSGSEIRLETTWNSNGQTILSRIYSRDGSPIGNFRGGISIHHSGNDTLEVELARQDRNPSPTDNRLIPSNSMPAKVQEQMSNAEQMYRDQRMAEIEMKACCRGDLHGTRCDEYALTQSIDSRSHAKSPASSR